MPTKARIWYALFIEGKRATKWYLNQKHMPIIVFRKGKPKSIWPRGSLMIHGVQSYEKPKINEVNFGKTPVSPNT